MRLKEANALLNKLAKNTAAADKPLTVTYPGFIGFPEWDEVAIVETKTNIFVVPKKLEDSIEEDHTPAQVADLLQSLYNQRDQQGSAA